MQIKVLGCSGGIGEGLKTTSLLVNQQLIIDAGTGLGDLPIESLAQIDHVFLTHSHLDHIALLPLLIDTVGAMRKAPITVWGSGALIDILQKHIFNWLIWPDFAQIPSASSPFMRYEILECGESVTIGDVTIRALPANHTVPAVGYQLDDGDSSVVFTGDTSVNDALWPMLNQMDNLKHLIIETAFCNKEKDLALASRHLCPSLLADELEKLNRPAVIWVTHLKPGEVDITMREIQEDAGRFGVKMLQHGQIIEC